MAGPNHLPFPPAAMVSFLKGPWAIPEAPAVTTPTSSSTACPHAAVHPRAVLTSLAQARARARAAVTPLPRAGAWLSSGDEERLSPALQSDAPAPA